MKPEKQYYVAAVDSSNNETLCVSLKYTDKTELERKYAAWCIRMMIEGQGVLDCLETVHFEILETGN